MELEDNPSKRHAFPPQRAREGGGVIQGTTTSCSILSRVLNLTTLFMVHAAVLFDPTKEEHQQKAERHDQFMVHAGTCTGDHGVGTGKMKAISFRKQDFTCEDIQRNMANNPDISNSEAFNTVAKYWAHFPHLFWADVRK
ncbi:hypothetical protein Fmac_016070 [Flemingia macrophylla]|uniref:YABBY protein C-terminal domain-containing protein n=1 Tax=Flemingia macrophylla TaxID=520843 RepID=A0ABD1MGB3_9FABA